MMEFPRQAQAGSPSRVGGADGQERDRAVGAGAVGEAVAAGVDDLGQRGADRGEVGDLRVDLGDLVDRALPQVRSRVPAAAGVEQVGDLVEGEPEPLRRLDDVEQGDGVGWVEPVPADRADRFG